MNRLLLTLLLLFAPAAACAQSSASKRATPALASSLVAKAAPGNLWSVEVAADGTLSGAAWWIMVYDAIAAPADGAVTPAKCYAVASGVTSYWVSFTFPPHFTAGIVVGVSTTGCFNKTASTHAFISVDYQ